MKIQKAKKCKWCGQLFAPEHKGQKCCSKDCAVCYYACISVASWREPQKFRNQDDVGDYEIDRRVGFDPDICGD